MSDTLNNLKQQSGVNMNIYSVLRAGDIRTIESTAYVVANNLTELEVVLGYSPGTVNRLEEGVVISREVIEALYAELPKLV